MNDEEKKFLTELVDKEREFHINLADIGMRFGTSVALALVLFSSGIVLLFSAADMLIQHGITQLEQPSIAPPFHFSIIPSVVVILLAGFFLIAVGVIILSVVIKWKDGKISDLKKKLIIQPKKVKVTRSDCFNYLFHCQMYDGIDAENLNSELEHK